MEPYEPQLLTSEKFYEYQDRMGKLSPKPLSTEEVLDLLFTIGEQNKQMEQLRNTMTFIRDAVEGVETA